MKKAYNKSIILKGLLRIIVCLIFFNFTACGLDTFYVIESPGYGSNTPTYSSVEEKEKYFEFRTNEKWYDEDSEFKFSGTDVYYRIYNNSSTLNTEINRIITLSDVTNASSSASTALIDTYKYKKLKMSNHKASTLIPYTGTNKKITIRLTEFLAEDTEENKARIFIDGVSEGEPLRNSSEVLSFEFARTSENIEKNVKPKDGDEDVTYGTFSVTDPNEWYVAMFAIAVGRDNTFSEILSIPIYLGSICIPEED